MSLIDVTQDPRRAPFVCAFDQTPHESLEALHAHLKRYRVSREKYYTLYYPRKDPCTGAPIPFRDLDQYLSQEFTSKVTLKKWLKENPIEGYTWAKGWLARRKEEKGLIYAPSQVELRSLCCPTMPYFDDKGKAEGGYYGVTRALGYADRYSAAPFEYTPLAKDAVVIRDTREQTPITLPIVTRAGTVHVGDYALDAPYDLGVRIERKSVNDFFGTLSGRKVERKGGRKGTGVTEDSALQRFDRELARAAEGGLYVVMMVEETLSYVESVGYLPHMKHIKASPSYILHNLRDLLTKYPLSFQCVFVDGRAEMSRTMMRVFELGARVKTLDLGYAYERKLL